MQARLISGGDGLVHLTAAANYAAGEVLAPSVVGGLVCGVVSGSSPVKTGDRFAVITKGTFDIDSASATTFSKNAIVQFNDTTNLAVASGDFALGAALLAKTSGQTKVRVNLNEFGNQPDT